MKTLPQHQRASLETGLKWFRARSRFACAFVAASFFGIAQLGADPAKFSSQAVERGPVQAFTTTVGPAVADFDANGFVDVATADGSTGSLYISFGSADGTETNVTTTAGPASPVGLVAGDMDGDGFSDLIFAKAGSVQVWVNDGSGTFIASTFDVASPTVTITKVAVANDFNGDGLPDIVAIGTGDNGMGGTAGFVEIFLSTTDVDGKLTGYGAPITFDGDTQPNALVVADLNHDDFPDVVFSDAATRTVHVYFGDPDGFTNMTDLLINEQDVDLGTHVPASLAVGDVTRDNVPDIVATSSLVDAVHSQTIIYAEVINNNNDGTFDLTNGFGLDAGSGVTVPSSAVAVGDVNIDGNEDIVGITSFGRMVVIRLNPPSDPLTVTAEGIDVFNIGTGAKTLSLETLDSDAKLDALVAGDGNFGVIGLLNQTTSTVVGNGVQFDQASYSVNKGAFLLVLVSRPTSTDELDVPFTVGGTAIPSNPHKPSAPSDYNLDDPADKVLHFNIGETQTSIFLSISGELAPGNLKTIVLTLKTPMGNAQLGSPTTTTINIVRGPITLHAATGLKAKPTNKITLTADEKKQKVIAGGRANSPWEFQCTQKFGASEPGLSVRVQFAVVPPPVPEPAWTDVTGGRLTLKGGKGTTWTGTVDTVPTCARIYFRTVTTASNDNDGLGDPVGPYKTVKSPHLALTVTQAREIDAQLHGDAAFTTAEIATHNDEAIHYRFRYKNNGNEDAAVNTTMEISLPQLGHFQAATNSHVAGAQIVQLAKGGKTTTDNGSTIALRYVFSNGIPMGTDDTVDVVVTVVSANEYNPKNASASFNPVQLPLSTHGFIESKSQAIRVDSTPDLIARITSPLKIEIATDNGLSSPGGYITYTLTATNLTGFDMQTPVITDLVPFGTALDTVYDVDGNGNYTGAAVKPPGPLSHTSPPSSLAIVPLSGGEQTQLKWTLDKLPKTTGGSNGQRQMKFKVQVLYDVPTVVPTGPHSSTTAQIHNDQYQLLATPPSGGTIAAFVNPTDSPDRTVGLASDPNIVIPIPALKKDVQGVGTVVVSTGVTLPTVVPNGTLHYVLHVRNDLKPGANPASGLPLHHVVIHDFINSDTNANKPIDSTFVDLNSITLKDQNNTPLPISGNLLSSYHFVLKDGLGNPLPAGTNVALTRAIDFTLADLPSMGEDGEWLIEYDVVAEKATALTPVFKSVPDKIGTFITTGDYFMTSDSLSSPTQGAPRDTQVQVVAPAVLNLLPTSVNLPAPPPGSKFSDGIPPGAIFSYDLHPKNSGGVAAVQVLLNSVLPKGVQFQGFFDALGTEITSGVTGTKGQSGKVGLSLAQLAAGDSPLIRLKVQLQSDLEKSFPAALRALGASFKIVPTLSGGYTGPSHFAFGRAAANTFVPVDDATTDPTEIPVAHALQPILFLGKIAPLAVLQGDTLDYTLFYGNTGNDTARGVTIAIYVPNNTEIFATSPKVNSYNSSKRIATWNIGDVPPHTAGAVILTVQVNQDDGTIREGSAVIHAANAIGQAAGVVTTTVSATSFFGHLHEMWDNAFGGLHLNIGDAIKTNNFLKADFKSIKPDSQFISISNAPVITLKNTGFLIPLGPINGVGQVLVGGKPTSITGGNELVTGIPIKLVSGDGNQIDVKDVGMATGDNIGLVLANIHGDHGAQLSQIGNVQVCGPGLIANDGMTVLHNDGLAPTMQTSTAKGAGLLNEGGAQAVLAGAGSLLSSDASGMIGNAGGLLKPGGKGAKLLSEGGGQLVATGGGNVISNDGGSVISNDGGSLITNDGGTLITEDGGGIISHNGSAIIGEHSSGFAP